jgi:lipopolysaccharide/colanic/teichoic acid biosynthesis glycosyltransferase
LTVGKVLLAAALAVSWQLCGAFLGIHDVEAREGWWPAIGQLITCSLVVTLFLGAYLDVFGHYARSFRIMGAFFCCALSCDLLRISLASRFSRRPNRVVIVGSDRLAAKAWREFRTHPRHRMELAGFVDQSLRQNLPPDFASRHLGALESLPRIVIEQGIDDVIVAIPVAPDDSSVQRAIALAGALGARILCLKDMCGIRPENIGRDYGDTFFELVPAPQFDGVAQFLKRGSDIVIAALLLLTLIPLLAVVAIVEALRGRSVRFQADQKVGFRRKPFQSFRVVRERGDAPLQPWLSHLPLAWSVLRGDMSLVGPAPLSEKELYLSDIDALAGRFNVRPGITGVTPHSVDSTFSASADEPYSGAPSFAADLRALARTFRALTRRTGAVETTAGAI